MVYYIETNLIAILAAVIMLYQGRTVSSRHETSQIIMKWMLLLLIGFSCSDIAAYCFRGESYLGVQISNMLYFIGMALGAFIWFLYIMVKVGYSRTLKHTILCTGGPMLILCIAILLNPLTNYFYTVDSSNLYHRGNGIFVTWIVEWGYMLCALIVNIRAVMAETRSYRRQELQGYLIFALPVAAAAACQMLFYGTTTTQIGFLFGILLAYLNMQQYQVQRDELTGLNNRSVLLRYQDSLAGRTTALNLTLFMIDANHFKDINDAYGHLKGDQALKDIASVLKMSVGQFTQNRVLLFRYGGDEFIIVGNDLDPETIQRLQEQIHRNLAQVNAKNRDAGEKYVLSLSIGCASKACSSQSDFDELMKDADNAMYLVKQASKAQR